MLIPSKDIKVLQKHGINYLNYFLSVSRAQEDNYIHILLDAFVKTQGNNLVVISNWQSCTYGINLKKNYSNYPNIKLVDAVYDQNELDVIRSNAEWYVHTHSACGSAPSLIEGMSLGLPIISFDVPANRSTTEGRAIYFKDTEELKRILQSIDNFNKNELASIMKEIAYRRYTWKIISGKYKELF